MRDKRYNEHLFLILHNNFNKFYFLVFLLIFLYTIISYYYYIIFMKITKKHFLSFSLLSFLTIAQIFLFVPNRPILADDSLLNSQTGMPEVRNVYGGKDVDIRLIIAKIINIVLGFIAIIFLVLLIIAGYRYMMASGNEEAVKKSTSQIKQSIIGLIIIIAAWGISRWILLRIRAAVENNPDLFYPI